MLTATDIKPFLRISSNVYDSEVTLLIEAAYADIERVGIDPDEFEENKLIDHAVVCYCKAHFGYDNEDATRLEESYRRILISLMNSNSNLAARRNDAIQ